MPWLLCLGCCALVVVLWLVCLGCCVLGVVLVVVLSFLCLGSRVSVFVSWLLCLGCCVYVVVSLQLCPGWCALVVVHGSGGKTQKAYVSLVQTCFAIFFFFMSGVFFCYIYSVKKHVDSVIFCNKRKNNCAK